MRGNSPYHWFRITTWRLTCVYGMIWLGTMALNCATQVAFSKKHTPWFAAVGLELILFVSCRVWGILWQGRSPKWSTSKLNSRSFSGSLRIRATCLMMSLLLSKNIRGMWQDAYSCFGKTDMIRFHSKRTYSGAIHSVARCHHEMLFVHKNTFTLKTMYDSP